MAELRDKYPSVAALTSALSQDIDYRIRCHDRDSDITIVSPHGGFIEAGTSAIARAIAYRDMNFFDFQGLQEVRPWELHVTATRFEHAELDKLLAKSQVAVSVHSMGASDSWNVWLGGLNMPLKRLMKEALIKHGFPVVYNPPKYRGESPRNVVNRVPRKGVQLELPKDLIEAMYEDRIVFLKSGAKLLTNDLFRRFVTAVRSAILKETRVLSQGKTIGKTSHRASPERNKRTRVRQAVKHGKH